MSTYRTGGHWGVTIVREGTQPPDATGHRPDAQLVAVVVNGDQALAQRICALLNTSDGEWAQVVGHGEAQIRAALGVADSCTCTIVGPDPDCPVHQGRKARGPKPPPAGPGCICDGSGRICPRHGVVL